MESLYAQVASLVSSILASAVFSTLVWVTAVACSCGLIVGFLRKRSATLAHFVCSTAIVTILLVPACVWVNGVTSIPVAILPALKRVEPDVVALRRVVPTSPTSNPFVDSHPVESGDESQPLHTLDSVNSRGSDVAIIDRANSGVMPPTDEKRTSSGPGVSGRQDVIAPWGLERSVVFIWLAGVIAMLFRLSFAARVLPKAVIDSRPAGSSVVRIAVEVADQMNLTHAYRIRIASSGRMPFAFWWRHWTVILPDVADSWDERRLRSVLAHEFGHLVRKDALTDFMGQLACCFYWFHPLVWMVVTDCRRLREQACDDLVIARTQVLRANYATHLLDVVSECTMTELPLASAMAGASDIDKRIRRVLSGGPIQLPTIRLRRMIAATVSTLVLCGSLFRLTAVEAQATNDVPPNVAESQDGNSANPEPIEDALNVRGIVVDEHGHPFAGAELTLRVIPHAFGANITNESYDEVLAKNKSDRDGKFEFSNVAIPRAFIRNQPAANRNLFEVVATHNDYGVSWESFKDRDVDNLTIQLRPGDTLDGIIVDTAGQPVKDAIVHINAISDATVPFDAFASTPDHLNYLQSRTAPETMTDANGHFQFANMPINSFVALHVRHSDHPRHFQYVAVGPEARPGTYGRGPHKTTIPSSPMRVTLEQGYKVDVRIVDTNGEPVVCESRVRGPSAYHKFPASPDGRFRVAFKGPGEYNWSFKRGNGLVGLSKQDVVVDERHSDRPMAVTWRLPRTRRMTGRVVVKGTNEPVGDLGVQWQSDPDNDLTSYASSTRTEKDGSFSLEAVPGEGKFSFSGESHDAFVISHRTLDFKTVIDDFYHPITVPAEGDVHTVELAISRGTVIGGTVRDKDGQPVADATVVASTYYWPHPHKRKVNTNADGEYQFVALNPWADYELTAISDRLIGRFHVTGDPTRRVTEEHHLQVDIVARPAVAIVGKILDGGKPADRIDVELKVGRNTGAGGTRYTQLSRVSTDNSGEYRLYGLLPGDLYHVDANPTFAAADPEWSHRSPNVVKVPIDAVGDYRLPDMNLVRYEQTLAGRVVDPDGNPVSGARVSARLPDGSSLARSNNRNIPAPWTETDDAGRFTLKALPNKPLGLMAYIRSKSNSTIRFPAKLTPKMNQHDIRIVLDPSLVED